MGTPYIGHGYLDMTYDAVPKTLTTYYALPWQHDWEQPLELDGKATITRGGEPLDVQYEVCYIPPTTSYTAAAPMTLTSPDGLFQVTVTTSGVQAYGYYVVLVQGYADATSHSQPASGAESSGESYGQSYDLLLTRVPKPTGVDTANLEKGPWKYHWGKRLPDDNHDITVKIASVQTGFSLERLPKLGSSQWKSVTDADNVREFGRFRLHGQAKSGY